MSESPYGEGSGDNGGVVKTAERPVERPQTLADVIKREAPPSRDDVSEVPIERPNTLTDVLKQETKREEVAEDLKRTREALDVAETQTAVPQDDIAPFDIREKLGKAAAGGLTKRFEEQQAAAEKRHEDRLSGVEESLDKTKAALAETDLTVSPTGTVDGLTERLQASNGTIQEEHGSLLDTVKGWFRPKKTKRIKAVKDYQVSKPPAPEPLSADEQNIQIMQEGPGGNLGSTRPPADELSLEEQGDEVAALFNEAPSAPSAELPETTSLPYASGEPVTPADEEPTVVLTTPSEPTPAADDEPGTSPADEPPAPPPAPPPADPFTPTAPDAVVDEDPLTSKKIKINIAAVKHDIGADTEAIEQAMREEARRRQLSRERGLLGGIKDAPRRIVATLLQSKDYRERKEEAAAALAAAGLQITAFSNDFRQEFTQVAQEWKDQDRVQAKQDRRDAKATTSRRDRTKDAGKRGVKALVRAATLEQKEIDKKIDALSMASRFLLFNEGFDPSAADAEASLPQGVTLDAVRRVTPDLLTRMKKELLGDIAAGEGLARRLTMETGESLLNGALHETRTDKPVTLSVELTDKFKNDIMIPALTDALENDGTITDETRLKLNEKVRELFYSKDFADWKDKEGWTDKAFTHVTDAIDQACRLAEIAKIHKDDTITAELYAQQLLADMDLEIEAGTVQSGIPGTTLKENFLERKVATHIDRKGVQQLYAEIQAGNEPDPVVPKAYEEAIAQVSMLDRAVRGATGEGMVGGIGYGLAVGYLAVTRGLRYVPGLNLAGMALGGVVGAKRGAEQYDMKAALHELDVARGVQFAPEHRLLPGLKTQTEKLRRLETPKIGTQQVIDRLTTALTEIESLPTAEADTRRDTLFATLGILTEIDARKKLEATRKVKLYRATTNEQAERTEIALLEARAKVALTRYLETGTNANDLNDLVVSRLGFTGLTHLGPDEIREHVAEIVDRLSHMQQTHLITGDDLYHDSVMAGIFALNNGYHDLSFKEQRKHIKKKEKEKNEEIVELLQLTQIDKKESLNRRRNRKRRGVAYQAIKHMTVVGGAVGASSLVAHEAIDLASRGTKLLLNTAVKTLNADTPVGAVASRVTAALRQAR